MRGKINISGISEAEEMAVEILEHVEEIRRLQKELAWKSADIEITLTEDKPISGN